MKEATRWALTGSRALRTFRCFEDSQALWKFAVGRTLTFVNAVLCLSSSAGHAKEIRQRSTGQPDLGVHGFVTNKAVKEDMPWSFCEEYEAVPKLPLEKRLSLITYRRWQREVRKYVPVTMSEHEVNHAHQTPPKLLRHKWELASPSLHRTSDNKGCGIRW
ncbi:hypothetical protein HPB48_026038 [Haemaphysalis longicornis]|uniref:Uncharacterized protein n=1 Tax=Haemaphysalis longicornis TaxID=44386 RepID=A0A9J6H9Q1_HAELO|nr:hypothetical protein HPB48_026038 [Haemaphysalis longicornis]